MNKVIVTVIVLLSSSLGFAQEYSCGQRKTCGRMQSCTEAYFHLKQCGDVARDRDRDGIPCEKLCGKTLQRMKRLLDAGL
ncbi:excalibur calcium-binding domain-containing protein [Lentilitoribacter sp. EG35]|uniref:excalibur calcium-binding domain-containing protein n=1 Tax=Lentilitoribacter sp. EG35 TaxID=3234192 RepID=UPI00346134ED